MGHGLPAGCLGASRHRLQQPQAPRPSLQEQDPDAGSLHCPPELMSLATQTEIQLPQMFYHVNIRQQFIPGQTLSVHKGSDCSMHNSLHL